MTLELVMIRHGETTWNAERRLAGWTDVPLTELGRAQAASLRGRVDEASFEGIWASDLSRAMDTGRLAVGQEPSADARLREMDFGQLEGKPWERLDPTLVERISRFQDFQAPGGESVADLQGRVVDFIEGLGDGRHLIFTHGGVIRALTERLGRTRFVGNCATVVIDWRAQALVLQRELDGREFTWP